MSRSISKRRLEMGEEKWSEYQRQRKNKKAEAYKNRNARSVIEWRQRTKMKLIEYKGGGCEFCGYNKPFPSCYDFHHINPEEKEFQIGGSTKKYETLMKEADKCLLLCKNCHFELHDKEYAEEREKRIAEIENEVLVES